MNEYRSFYYDDIGREPITDDFAVPKGTEMTEELLLSLIDEHKQSRVPRYMRLKAAYGNKSAMFSKPKKEDWKPDNRLAADIPKYLNDTFEGYFIGMPIDYSINGEKSGWVTDYTDRNDQDTVDADISDYCSRYGNAFELLYQNADGEPASAALEPISTFVVYDDTVLHNPLYGVRYHYDEEGFIGGSYSDSEGIYTFHASSDGVAFDDMDPHSFGEVPIIEYVQNKEKRGIYEGVLNLIEAYNKALSEKANDVDYFADAYLALLGAELDDDQMKDLRKYRIINLFGSDTEKIQAFFLQKPDGDATQENLINRLETLIFKLAMVPDISDGEFNTASGIALRWRLQPMSNLAKNKERRFKASVKRRFRLLANYPSGDLKGDDWKGVQITMKRNLPTDIETEANTAGSLAGIVSQRTQLGVLSIVSDPDKEIERMEEEKSTAADFMPQLPTNRTEDEDASNDHQGQEGY